MIQIKEGNLRLRNGANRGLEMPDWLVISDLRRLAARTKFLVIPPK